MRKILAVCVWCTVSVIAGCALQEPIDYAEQSIGHPHDEPAGAKSDGGSDYQAVCNPFEEPLCGFYETPSGGLWPLWMNLLVWVAGSQGSIPEGAVGRCINPW